MREESEGGWGRRREVWGERRREVRKRGGKQQGERRRGKEGKGERTKR